MKKILRSAVTLMLAVLMLAVMCTGAAAAKKKSDKSSKNIPANVRVLKATPGEKKADLKWTKVSGATGYYIYRVEGKKYKRVKITSSTKYTATNLGVGKTYKYAVKAYKKVKGKTYVSKSYKTISFTTKIITPEKPKNVHAVISGDKQITISWDRPKNATGYQVCLYENGKYKLLKTLTSKNKTSYTIGGLKLGKSYTFAVRTIRMTGGKKATSSYAPKVTIKCVTVSSAANEVHGMRYNAKTLRKTVVYNYTTKKQQTLAAGTKIISTEERPGSGNLTAYLSNGNKIKIKGSDISVYSFNYNSKTDYSEAVKEAYINKKKLSSPTNYLIWLDQYKCRVNIFKGKKNKWQLVRAGKCGIGTFGEKSIPKGIFRIEEKVPFGPITGGKELYYMGNSRWGNAFHSSLGATLGQPLTSGCIRLYDSDLNYMYANVPVGTTVFSS